MVRIDRVHLVAILFADDGHLRRVVVNDRRLVGRQRGDVQVEGLHVVQSQGVFHPDGDGIRTVLIFSGEPGDQAGLGVDLRRSAGQPGDDERIGQLLLVGIFGLDVVDVVLIYRCPGAGRRGDPRRTVD